MSADHVDHLTPDQAVLPQPDAPWLRLNTRMLLVHPVQELRNLLPLLVGLVFAGSGSGHSALFGLVGVAVTIGIGTIRWFTTRFRLTTEQVQVRRGLLSRRVLTVPLDRVRTVDVEANPLHRVFGLTRVKIGTGQTDQKKQEGLTLDGLSLGQADRLRDDLLHHRFTPGTAPPGAPAGDAVVVRMPVHVEEIVTLDPSWIRYGPFTLTGLVTVAALSGLLWRLVNEAHIDPARYSAARAAEARLRDTPVWLLVLQGAAGLLIATAIFSTIGYLLAFWRFRLTRTGEGTLHVTRGLLTTRATTIEERRLRGVELSEPLLLRSVGGARVVAIATGLRVGRGAERGGSLLLPPAPRRDAIRVCAAVATREAPFLAPLVPHGPRARRRRLIRSVVPALVLLAAAALVWWWGAGPAWTVFAAVWLALAVPLGLDRYRSVGHLQVDGHLVVREGSLVRRRSALATDAVIGWNLRSTLFQRRSGLVTLTATTACGRQKYRALDLDRSAALELADNVVPGLLRPFLLPEADAGHPAGT